MNEHLSSASLKSLAKGQLLGNYGPVVGAAAIHLAYLEIANLSAALFVDTSTVPGNMIYYMISLLIGVLGGVFMYGEAYISLKIACNQKVRVNDLFYGFSNGADRLLPIAAVMAAVSLICGLPNLLLNWVTADQGNPYRLLLYVILLLAGSVINILFHLIFSQCYYLMLDFPQYSPKEIFQMSRKIMKGSKGRLFYIDISFLPLYLLGMCSCCVGFFWLYPYIHTVKANFYLDLMKKRKQA